MSGGRGRRCRAVVCVSLLSSCGSSIFDSRLLMLHRRNPGASCCKPNWHLLCHLRLHAVPRCAQSSCSSIRRTSMLPTGSFSSGTIPLVPAMLICHCSDPYILAVAEADDEMWQLKCSSHSCCNARAVHQTACLRCYHFMH